MSDYKILICNSRDKVSIYRTDAALIRENIYIFNDELSEYVASCNPETLFVMAQTESIIPIHVWLGMLKNRDPSAIFLVARNYVGDGDILKQGSSMSMQTKLAKLFVNADKLKQILDDTKGHRNEPYYPILVYALLYKIAKERIIDEKGCFTISSVKNNNWKELYLGREEILKSLDHLLKIRVIPEVLEILTSELIKRIDLKKYDEIIEAITVLDKVSTSFDDCILELNSTKLKSENYAKLDMATKIKLIRGELL